MAAVLAVVFMLFVSVDAVAVDGSGEECIQQFHHLWKSFHSRHANIDRVQHAMLPPNSPASVQIDVFYHFSTTLMYACKTSSEHSGACNYSSLHLLNLSSMPFDYKFRWSSTSVHNYIRPKLLERLSLFTYQAQITEVHIVIDPICGHRSEYNGTEVCREPKEEDITSPGLDVKLLDELTCHVSLICWPYVHF